MNELAAPTTRSELNTTARIGDIMMHQLFNARERSKEEWTALFLAADSRFEVESFTLIPPAVLSTIVLTWAG